MADRFVLFVSCVPEQGPVTRFGTRTIIGAERLTAPAPDSSPRRPRAVVSHEWRPDEVVAISAREHALYRREYDRALANGSLRKRTELEWNAQNDDQRGGTPAAPETAPAELAAAPPSAGVTDAHPRRRPQR